MYCTIIFFKWMNLRPWLSSRQTRRCLPVCYLKGTPVRSVSPKLLANAPSSRKGCSPSATSPAFASSSAPMKGTTWGSCQTAGNKLCRQAVTYKTISSRGFKFKGHVCKFSTWALFVLLIFSKLFFQSYLLEWKSEKSSFCLRAPSSWVNPVT